MKLLYDKTQMAHDLECWRLMNIAFIERMQGTTDAFLRASEIALGAFDIDGKDIGKMLRAIAEELYERTALARKQHHERFHTDAGRATLELEWHVSRARKPE